MYPQGQLGAVAALDNPKPAAPQIIEDFERNLSYMNSSIAALEDRCHKLLNLRTPEKQEKVPTPMENDLVQQLGNRLDAFSRMNERLQAIVNHLDKII